MRPSSQVQLFTNPFPSHARLRPQPPRQPHLADITLGTCCQVFHRPTQLVQFFLQNPTRFSPGTFPPRLGLMVFSRPRGRLRQQFLPERFAAQTPAAPDAFKFPAVFLRPALVKWMDNVGTPLAMVGVALPCSAKSFSCVPDQPITRPEKVKSRQTHHCFY